jgi:hypothetical protein
MSAAIFPRRDSANRSNYRRRDGELTKGFRRLAERYQKAAHPVRYIPRPEQDRVAREYRDRCAEEDARRLPT